MPSANDRPAMEILTRGRATARGHPNEVRVLIAPATVACHHIRLTLRSRLIPTIPMVALFGHRARELQRSLPAKDRTLNMRGRQQLRKSRGSSSRSIAIHDGINTGRAINNQRPDVRLTPSGHKQHYCASFLSNGAEFRPLSQINSRVPKSDRRTIVAYCRLV